MVGERVQADLSIQCCMSIFEEEELLGKKLFVVEMLIYNWFFL